MATIVRETKETRVRVDLSPSGSGVDSEADTSVAFLDHMLITLARYAGLTLRVRARGDLQHHIVEDVAICVGAALAQVTPPNAMRYGERTIPMDDALVQCAVDIGGRPYYRGPLPARLYGHWMRPFADKAPGTVDLCAVRGPGRPHVIEAAI